MVSVIVSDCEGAPYSIKTKITVDYRINYSVFPVGSLEKSGMQLYWNVYEWIQYVFIDIARLHVIINEHI